MLTDVERARKEWEKSFAFFCKKQDEYRKSLASGTPALMEDLRFQMICAMEALADVEIMCAKVYRGMLTLGDRHGNR